MEYIQIPIDILETNKEIKDLTRKYGAYGLGVFFRIFFKCVRYPNTLFMFRIDENFIKDITTELHHTRTDKVKRVIQYMVDLEIIDKKLYDVGLLFMPLLAQIGSQYAKKLLYSVRSNVKVYAEMTKNYNYVYTNLQNASTLQKNVQNDYCFLYTYDSFVDYFSIYIKERIERKERKDEDSEKSSRRDDDFSSSSPSSADPEGDRNDVMLMFGYTDRDGVYFWNLSRDGAKLPKNTFVIRVNRNKELYEKLRAKKNWNFKFYADREAYLQETPNE